MFFKTTSLSGSYCPIDPTRQRIVTDSHRTDKWVSDGELNDHQMKMPSMKWALINKLYFSWSECAERFPYSICRNFFFISMCLLNILCCYYNLALVFVMSEQVITMSWTGTFTLFAPVLLGERDTIECSSAGFAVTCKVLPMRWWAILESVH